MTAQRASEMTPAEHIARAKAEAGAGDYESATVHALIAIAETMQVNLTEAYIEGAKVGAGATTDALSQITALAFGASNLCSKPEPDQVSDATRAMCRVLFGDDFDLHGQDDDDRAHYERAAEAAIEASR